MKKNLHPKDYRPVVFEDLNTGFRFITKSTVKTAETTKWEDGNEYPLFKVHISSDSHPFYTGQEKLVDIEGRVDKFKARREAGEKARLAKEEAAKTKKAAKKTKKAKEVDQIDIPQNEEPQTKETTQEEPKTKE
jgi:large subunit ribosomal protein L31